MTKGQHANAEESQQANPFPSLFILVEGSLQGRVGGKETTLRGGEAVFVPAEVAHEFWNENEEAAVPQRFSTL